MDTSKAAVTLKLNPAWKNDADDVKDAAARLAHAASEHGSADMWIRGVHMTAVAGQTADDIMKKHGSFDWPNGPPPAQGAMSTSEVTYTSYACLNIPREIAQSDLVREIEKWCSPEWHVQSRDAEIENLKAQLASAQHDATVARRLALMAKVERDTAVAERNMTLRAYIAAIEEQVVENRKAESERQAESPGAKALNAIAVTQDANRVR